MKAAHKLEIRFSKSDIDIIPSLSLTRRPPAAGPGPGPGPPFQVLYKAPGHKNIKKKIDAKVVTVKLFYPLEFIVIGVTA